MAEFLFVFSPSFLSFLSFTSAREPFEKIPRLRELIRGGAELEAKPEPEHD